MLSGLFSMFARFGRSVVQACLDAEFRALLVLLFMILIGGTVTFHFVEGWSLLDSLYFSVITLTTIGYGDLSPTTDLGKFVTLLFILAGVGLSAGFVVYITKRVRRATVTAFVESQAAGMGAKPDFAPVANQTPQDNK